MADTFLATTLLLLLDVEREIICWSFMLLLNIFTIKTCEDLIQIRLYQSLSIFNCKKCCFVNLINLEINIIF